MIVLKSEKEIRQMLEACRISAEALKVAGEAVEPGVSTWEIDRIARKYIESKGAKPTFLNYNGFPASACISINDEVIHGIPDKKRILRAIEIFEISGKTKTERDVLSKKNGPAYDNLFIGLGYKDREVLYNRINTRVDLMIQKGLVNEALAAYKTDRGTAAQAIGHKELFKYFSGEMPLEAAVDHLKTQTRHYAKRQLTWFRKNENINWIYMDEDNNPVNTALKIINDFLNK